MEADIERVLFVEGLSDRLGIPWSLSKEWAPIARRALEGNIKQSAVADPKDNKVRIRDVMKLLKTWGRGKVNRGLLRLPSPVRTKAAAVALRLQKRREAKETKMQQKIADK